MVELLINLKWPLIILQAVVAPILVILVLVQSSKGDDLGSALSGGGGGSSSVLGAGGASRFLVKVTVVFAAVFLINSVILAKVFRETSLASVGTSQSEPLAPANALDFDLNNQVAPNAVDAPPADGSKK